MEIEKGKKKTKKKKREEKEIVIITGKKKRRKKIITKVRSCMLIEWPEMCRFLDRYTDQTPSLLLLPYFSFLFVLSLLSQISLPSAVNLPLISKKSMSMSTIIYWYIDLSAAPGSQTSTSTPVGTAPPLVK